MGVEKRHKRVSRKLLTLGGESWHLAGFVDKSVFVTIKLPHSKASPETLADPTGSIFHSDQMEKWRQR
jgi:hypothetical protein